MQVQFEGRGERWSGAAERVEETESIGPKRKPIVVQPYAVRVKSDAGNAVDGTMLVTDQASQSAAKRRDPEVSLGQAFSRALTAELGLRPLRSGFRFVIDHRWVVGY